MHWIFGLGSVAVLLVAGSPHAVASDARAIALGGATVANGQGVHGAVTNPASMMAMKRRNESLHIRFGLYGEFRDTGDAIDTLSDSSNEDLISDIDAEIFSLSQTNIQCNPVTGIPADTCVTGTQRLSDLSTRMLKIIDLVDGETVDARLGSDFGAAYTRVRYPFAINLAISATGSTRPDIADNDRDYIEDFAALLDDNEITLEEVQNSSFLEVDALGLPLLVTQPEDVLQSETSAEVLVRTQLGVSIATTLNIGQREFDLGITPKFSTLTAYRVEASVADEFADSPESTADRFEDSEISKSSFTFDVGGTMLIETPVVPVHVAAVIKNVVSESIRMNDGFTFNTEPQLLIGAALHRGMVSVTADMAVNPAKVDNFETQKIGVGVEFGTRLFSLRGGIGHDAARDNDATSLTLGFGLGPLEFGARLTGVESLETGFQLSHSFR
ncbi:MAG: conjugal transfer protein TraF [Granulosicoccus sp.]